MVGGCGSRLRPMTYTTPKCLLPISDGTVLSHILNNALVHGLAKSILIGHYFFTDIMGYCHENKFNPVFIKEAEPMGTCGGISLVSELLTEDFFVVNCDTLTNINYENMLETHKANDNIMTIAVYPLTNRVDYAVVYGEDDKVTKIKEKPSYTCDVSIGLYCFSPKALEFICGKMNIDELINTLLDKKLKVGYYSMTPENEYWYDIGRSVEDYKKVNSRFKEIV